ncbi:SNF2-related protein [Tundrisphaera lichenicola]|uniref:DEAD/DEAH box helicase n=1 Tax=Tundrisphaera lichenicola TaxID=2029860 RepID=UPI003EB6DB01
MMGIAQKLAREFSDAVRSRGQSYFAKGRVAITASSAGEVVAKVKGTERYKVRLRLRGIKLISSCSCPYFGPAGAPCKHLWATLLAVDARGLLPSAPARPLRLITDQPQRQPQRPPIDGIEGLPPLDSEPLPYPLPGPGQNPPRGQRPPRGQEQTPGNGRGPGYPPQQRERGPGQGYPPQQRERGPGPGYPPQQRERGPGQGYPPQQRERGPGPGYPPQQRERGPGPGYPPQQRERGPGPGYPPPQRERGPGPGYPPQQRERGPGPGPGYPPRGDGPGQGAPGYPPRGPGQGTPGYPPRGRGPGPGPGQPHQARGPNGPGPGRPGRPNPKDRRVRGVPGEGVNGNVNLQQARAQAKAARAALAAQQKSKRLLAYILDVPTTLSANQIVIDLARRARRPNGDWGPLKPWWHTPNLPVVRYDPEDRDLLAILVDAQAPPSTASAVNSNAYGESAGTRRFVLKPEFQSSVVEQLAKAGRLRLRRTDGEDDPPLARWDDQPPWRFGIEVKSDPTGKRWSWRGILRRPDGRGGVDRMDLAEPMAILPGLIVQGVGKIARLDDAGLYSWVTQVRHEKELMFPDSASQDAMFEKLLAESPGPVSDLIESEVLQLRETNDVPQPCLTLRTPRQNWGTDRLIAELGFDYAGAYVPIIRPGDIAVRTDLNLVVRRQVALEQAAGIQLYELGFKDAKDQMLDPGSLELPAKRVPQVTKELVQAGWRVEAEGKLIRQAGEFKLAVTTGIDWFELGGQVDFGGQSVPLPDLLAAARSGETMVTLGDGSMGMLPEDWLKKYGMLADLGTTEGENGPIRFGKAQAGLLDALLASQPEIKLDIGFGKVRQALPRFEGVFPKEAPPGFRGELRPYQREGLGWLEYLQKFDFGGILADDMGLGKTIQVLALLQSRRARRLSKGPSLIVVPRSLVFNWRAEAEKFCPRLKVLDYTGSGRHASREEFDDYDLIVTTYGTLRTDIVELSQITFDYVILDEAQAIKNADSQAAKAARLLKGRHRLAMSGTPIENHLGELWSIFEFLNPGMLGTASVFKKHASGASAADEGARSLLARALRPFILRRTKQQVVKDLPEKFEQTLICDLEPAQRKLYEGLKAHYRQALLRKDTAELGRSKIEVLEALLRLRQAACHPGLIDPEHSGDPSAKLDMLIPTLVEVAEEGHKILVFSQFTKFLGLVRDRLDAEGLKYEYLDGRTRNREERVQRFQNDPDIPLFLISLKAGGLGLNLTAAGYVYLLDPWWNPAVEAQAIDRSHRIGQTQQVFAYRLICRDTVEQKILELQQKKRDLADAILNENRNVIGTLTKDDLEFLLS